MPRRGTPRNAKTRLYSTPRWRRLREAVLARDGRRCQIKAPGCTGAATEVDHIVPVEAGGPFWDPGNLRAACAYCNRSAGARFTNRERAEALAAVKGRARACPTGPHGPIGGICERCGYPGPSREW